MRAMNKNESKEKKDKKETEATKQKPKRRNYKKELEKALAERDELKDQLLRTAAEFDNFRKRSNNEKKDLVLLANADFVKSLLPVLDDFDRFIQAGKESDVESLRQGIELIYRNFLKILSDHGLHAMETVGRPFDPEKHDALMQVESKNMESDMVVDEHQKGYEFNDRVIRHAKVIVSK